jgi:hypothetical protein
VRPLAPLLLSLVAACRATGSKDGEYLVTPTGCDTSPVPADRTLSPEEAAGFTGEDGVMDDAECEAACEASTGIGDDASCVSWVQNEDGSIELSCQHPLYCDGRRFAGLRRAPGAVRIRGQGGSRPPATPPRHEDAVAGAWLARAAHDEAASVTAFRRLAAELRAHGAPAALVEAARAAARDEARHARLTRRLARARGAAPPPVRARRARPRGLTAFAVENAVEGCVNETWAAAVVLHQAVAAAEPEVRAALAEIAADEIRHAELAHAVHAWAWERLDAPGRARVRRARAAAVARLTEARYPAVLGLPDAVGAATLHAGMCRDVWT